MKYVRGDNSMIYITGDTHADFITRLKTASFPEQKEMTRNDYVIILGDFGGIWDGGKAEEHNLDWLKDKPFTTLFIDGNHENYDLLNTYPVSEWHGGKVHFIRPHVIHLMRGQVFHIENKTFWTFGGASSHDISDGILEPGDPRIKEWEYDLIKRFRINHETWWKEELPSEEEMCEGRNSMENINNEVDFILTHCGPSSIVALYSYGDYKPDVLTNYLEEIRQNVNYKKWFMGHYHEDVAITDKDIILYEQIIRIH